MKLIFKVTYLSFLISIIFSCSERKNQSIESIYTKWIGREIKFLDSLNMVFSTDLKNNEF